MSQRRSCVVAEIESAVSFMRKTNASKSRGATSFYLQSQPAPARPVMTFSGCRLERNSTRSIAFPLQQPLLARCTPAPAAGRAVFAHHAMTGHDQRETIGAAGAADRTRGFWCTDRARYLAVAARFAGRNPCQRVPHAPLECGRRDVERRQRLRAIIPAFELARDARDDQ